MLITNPLAQSTTGRQPGMSRRGKTSSFDLRSLRFACVYEGNDGEMTLPSCLVTFICKPQTTKDTGIPSGHRPTPRSVVKNTFEFDPNLDRSSLNWDNSAQMVSETESYLKATLYAEADFGDEFYDLDHCYLVLEQYSMPIHSQAMPPAVLIDDVVGVAYYEKNAME